MFEFPPEMFSEVSRLATKTLFALAILSLGWVFGHLIGKGLSRFLVKLGFESFLRRTVLGKALERSGTSCVKFFEFTIRWAVYLLAILLALDLFDVKVLRTLLQTAPEYLPNIAAGLLILFIGLLVVDLLADIARVVGVEAKLELATIIALLIRFVGYYVVAVMALSIMKVDVSILNMIGNALAWGIALGAGLGIGIAFGLGLKDYVAKNVERWISSTGEVAKKPEDFWSWYARTREGEKE
ncbi:MAG: mechanosensitive ion channel family protein [Candidatus Bathyarchaeia archaeon]